MSDVVSWLESFLTPHLAHRLTLPALRPVLETRRTLKRTDPLDTLKLRPQEFCLKSVNAPATVSLLHITKPHLSSSSSCFMVRSSFLSPSSMNLSSRARYSSRSCSISRRAHVDSRSLNENNYGLRTATARSGHDIVRGARGGRAERTGRASMVWFRPCDQKHEALRTGESSFDPTTENRDEMGWVTKHGTKLPE